MSILVSKSLLSKLLREATFPSDEVKELTQDQIKEWWELCKTTGSVVDCSAAFSAFFQYCKDENICREMMKDSDVLEFG